MKAAAKDKSSTMKMKKIEELEKRKSEIEAL